MPKIDLLQVGCNFQEIMNAVNALIAAHNDGESAAVVSYNDLADLPQINGVELKGNQDTATLLIELSGCTDYVELIETLATKAYSDGIRTAAITEAQIIADRALSSKLNKDLSNIEAVAYVGDKAYIPMVIGGSVVKISTRSLAAYVNNHSREDRYTLEASLRTQRRVLEIQEVKPGGGTYATKTEYVLGSSALFLNDERLFSGTDYIEVDSNTFTLITHRPLDADDVLVFEAVPVM